MTGTPRGFRSVQPAAWLIIALSAIQAAMLLGAAPIQRFVQYWMWYPTAKPAGSPWLLLALVAAPAVVLWLVFWKIAGRPALKVALLIALGYGLQIGFGWTEGRGLDGVRDRM